MKRVAVLLAVAFPVCGAAHAQEAGFNAPAAAGTAAHNPTEQGLADDQVGFSAGTLDYDQDADIVTVTGDVRMVRQGHRLRADKVVWNRATGEVSATGNVSATDPAGDTVYGDKVVLSETLQDGLIDNLLLVLADGGRLAARHGTRRNGVVTLDHAAYTPCAVVDDLGCPKQPLWQITAVRVTADPAKHRISYTDARLHLLGVPVLWLPALYHPDGSGGGGTGLLVPDLGYSRRNGLELATPYYFRFSSDRDLTITPHVFTRVLPALEGQYRQLTALGAFQLSGFLTYGDRLPAEAEPTLSGDPAERRGLRAYLDGSGKFQFTPEWSLTASGRYATDKTLLRRYDISRDDRLRSTVNLERVDENSYLSIAGWAVQSLRAVSDPGQQPIALPAIDYRRRLADPLLGGAVELQANSLSIIRTEGQDTQRAFASARWDLRRLTRYGQEITFTAYGRGDVYHSDENALSSVALYRGDGGWQTRGIAALAADLRWPLVGAAFGGTQLITPRVQVVASPPTRNLAIPNEDARAVDLEDSNLFALNRFPGYDRWEDGTRVSYGGDYMFTRPRLSVNATVGQSYRLTDKPSIFPLGTGLSSRFSDVVGRTVVKYGRYLELTHRYRLDKDTLGFRRNEIDLTLGSVRTYVTAGYLKLDRDISTALEQDLRDREEIRLGGRVQIARRWSVFGSTVVDLTGPHEDVTAVTDGFAPVRHRLGVAYEDDCFQAGLTWRKDYDETGDASRGSTFLIKLSFKNLGR